MGKPPRWIRQPLIWVLMLIFIALYQHVIMSILNKENDSGSSIPNQKNNGGLDGEVKCTGFRINSELCCNHTRYPASVVQRGAYWVMFNAIRAEKSFQCHETITFTTLSDVAHLDSLEPLLERWQGPISLAVYVPNQDFPQAVAYLLHLRHCGTSTLVRDLVTVHFFYDVQYVPTGAKAAFQSLVQQAVPTKCEPLSTSVLENSFKVMHDLDFPINLGRNIARDMATTHFVLAADIELYPSPGLIPEFLAMIRTNGQGLKDTKGPRVFVSAIFEIFPGHKLPPTKKELVELYNQGVVQSFHNVVCPSNHRIPEMERWLNDTDPGKMGVFNTNQRVGLQRYWEPNFIGTKDDPYYDERMGNQGKADKMPQVYEMCAQGYVFHVLNKAFLIHKPGIQRKVDLMKWKGPKIGQTKHLLRTKILPELLKKYGDSKDCVLSQDLENITRVKIERANIPLDRLH